jgi:hypothetical protein
MGARQLQTEAISGCVKMQGYLDNLKTRWRMIFSTRQRKFYTEVVPAFFVSAFSERNRWRPAPYLEAVIVLALAAILAVLTVGAVCLVPFTALYDWTGEIADA